MKNRVRCASSFKVPRKSFLLRFDVAEVPVWAACAKNKLLPLQLDEEEGRGGSYHTFSLLNVSDSLSTPHKKKNPSLQKALQAESGGFNTDKKRREGKTGRDRDVNVAGIATERTQLTSCCLKVQAYMFEFIRSLQRLKLCREIISNLEEFSTLIIYEKGLCTERYDMKAFQNKIRFQCRGLCRI